MKTIRLLVALCLLLTGVSFAENLHSEGNAYTAKAADFTAVLGGTYLMGWSVRESAGTPAVATIIIRNGADTDTGTGGVQCAASGGVTQVGGQELAFVELAANASDIQMVPNISAPKGICVDVVAGTVDVVLYTGRP